MLAEPLDLNANLGRHTPFVVTEPRVLIGAEDVTGLGGWRAYMNMLN